MNLGNSTAYKKPKAIQEEISLKNNLKICILNSLTQKGSHKVIPTKKDKKKSQIHSCLKYKKGRQNINIY